MPFTKGNSYGFKKGYTPWNRGIKTGISGFAGHKHTEESKKKESDNSPRYWKGKRFSDSHKKNLSENHADFRGEKSPNWKGGHSRNREEEKDWRLSIFLRDKRFCQKCGMKGKRSIPINAHHILSYTDNPELRFDINNGITLCKKCHTEFHRFFGYGNNTKEQLKIFLENSYKGVG